MPNTIEANRANTAAALKWLSVMVNAPISAEKF
jgi:hypothetical protein